MRPVINNRTQYKILPVGDDHSGIIYLEKRESLTVGEASAIDLIGARRQKAAIIASKLVKKISIDRGVSITEAQELLSPTRRADSTTEVKSSIEVDNSIAEAQELSSPTRSPNSTTEVDNSSVIYDYIEDFTELNSLSAIDSTNVSIGIATLLIQKRVAFPIELLEPVAFNATVIKIAPVSFYLKDKQVIKFGDCLVVVNGNHDLAVDEDYMIINVLPVSENLAVTVGFLYNKGEKKYQVGTDDWTEEDTKNCSNEFVSAINEFYVKERSRWKDEDPSPALPQGEHPPDQLIGVVSIGESNTTEY